MTYRSLAGLAAVMTTLAVAPAAGAAPVTVDLRIEGASKTLFEGRVTTDVRPFRFTNDPTNRVCDGTAAIGGNSPAPVPTRGAALAEAAERTPFQLEGTWFSFGASMTRVAGEDVSFDPATNRYLAEWENGEATALGSCADPIAPGDDVVFAYGTGSERVLALAGPAVARLGRAAGVRVTDAGTGAPVPGATVAGGVTGPDGTARIGPFTRRGVHALKAAKPGAIRSNRVRICVTDGADGLCGTAAPGPAPAPGPATPESDDEGPVGRIAGIAEKQRFKRRKAPRELRGSVDADPSGLRAVKLRLTRQKGRTCWLYSGRRERFLRRRCGKRYAFKIGEDASWSYLLPHKLRRGRYVLDVIAVDRAGNRDTLARGRSRVVFRVR